VTLAVVMAQRLLSWEAPREVLDTPPGELDSVVRGGALRGVSSHVRACRYLLAAVGWLRRSVRALGHCLTGGPGAVGLKGRLKCLAEILGAGQATGLPSEVQTFEDIGDKASVDKRGFAFPACC
jgi:hypothetical protein